MPARTPPVGKSAAAKLAAIGARLRAHREGLKISATTVAEAAGMSRVTLHRIERGEPSVTIGAYASALAAVGLQLELADQASEARRARAGLPRRILVADYQQLRRLAWQLGEVATLTPKEALLLYERNWKHVDEKGLSDRERELVRRLAETLGGGRLLV